MVPAFVLATVGGMDNQVLLSLLLSLMLCDSPPLEGGAEYDLYGELLHVPPLTIAQLEDYASTCASVQNLLLSLHAEGLWCKWAMGPVVHCRWNTTINRTDNRDRRMRRTWGMVMMPEEQGGGSCSYSGSRGGKNDNEDKRGGRGQKFARIGLTVPDGPAQGDWKTTKATIN